MQKGNLLKSYCKKMLSSRQAVGRDLPPPALLNKEEKQPCFMREAEDPDPAGRHKPCGMTSLFNNGNNGFTLIELLVVVLIIGILSAVALPQYQKAVMKSRFLTIKTLTQKIVEAEGAYYLANGEYTSDLDALSIDIPNLSSAQKQAIMSNYYYPWGRCVIDGLDNKYAQCFLYAVNQKIYGKEILSYQVWFVTKRVWCRAHLNNTTANEVCKNDGAHKIHNGAVGETIYEY